MNENDVRQVVREEVKPIEKTTNDLSARMSGVEAALVQMADANDKRANDMRWFMGLVVAVFIAHIAS